MPRLTLDVGKLVAQRRNVELLELGSDRLEKRMSHASPGAVRQHETRGRGSRDLQQTRYRCPVVDDDRDGIRGHAYQL